MKAITKEKLKKKLLSAGKFISDNRWMFLKMGIMASVVVTPDVGFCQAQGNSGIAALNQPLNIIKSTLTGPVPAVFTVISGAVGGLSWGMGWEQQITQRALKCVGGGAIAMGAGGVMDNVTGLGVDAFVFM